MAMKPSQTPRATLKVRTRGLKLMRRMRRGRAMVPPKRWGGRKSVYLQHLEGLLAIADGQDHLGAFALAQQRLAQGRTRADHGDFLAVVDHFQTGSLGAEEQPLFAAILGGQQHQRTELDTARRVEGAQVEVLE